MKVKSFALKLCFLIVSLKQTGDVPQNCTNSYYKLVNITNCCVKRGITKYKLVGLVKGVPVNMSHFVFAFCVFPTSCNDCYTGL